LIYADDVNLLGENINIKESSLEVNVEKTKHVHISSPQCRTNEYKCRNRSFENVVRYLQFKYC
jgi:hypothetical protein